MVVFASVKVGLDGLALELSQDQEKLDSIGAQITQMVADLVAFPGRHAEMLAVIDELVGGAPDDDAYKLLAAEKERLMEDYEALLVVAQEMDSSHNGG